MESETIFLAKFDLCSIQNGTFVITKKVYRIIQAISSEEARIKLRAAYRNEENRTFQLLNVSISEIIT